MQNIIYAVIGIILTVATLAMVAPSIGGATNGMTAKMLATEVSAISNSIRLNMATSGATDYSNFGGGDGTTYSASLKKVLPDVTFSDVKTRAITAKTDANISITIAAGANNDQFKLTLAGTGITADNKAAVIEAINKLAPVGKLADTATVYAWEFR